MSIKGIDAQMMVTRAVDYARESSAQLKKSELMQDYMAVQGRLLEQQGQKSVGGAQKAEQAGIHPDRQRGGGQAASDQERGTAEDSAAHSERELSEALGEPEAHLIDIRA
ncbi:MAG: hypothetical protein GXX99_02210 [Clostridiales bacterium]|nr:hypothetical protein [Clostridiales bacterium]